MPKYYFFTDTDLLQNQTTSSQAYGPQGAASGQDIFQAYNLHTVGAGAKAYAICEGIIVAQEVAGNSGLLNIVLRPIEPIKNGLPPIKYFIYRGIKKSSLLDVSGNLIASTNQDTLLYNVIDVQTKYNTQFGTTAAASKRNLGLDYTAAATGGDQLLDTATIESLFNKDNADIQLPKVEGGWVLGEFESTGNVGVEIVFEQLEKAPLTFAHVRAQAPKIQVTALGGSPTQAAAFEHQHDKEEILRYLDDAAFWSAFYGTKLFTKISTAPSFTAKRKAAIYDEVLVKYYNKNKVYVDLRNEHNHAYNYYGNYNNTLKVAYEETSPLSNQDYSTNDWPLLILDGTSFPTGNITRKQLLRLSLPQGDNPQPLLYLWHAQTKKSFPKAVKRRQQKFQDLKAHDTLTNYTTEVELVVPNKANNTSTTILCTYIRLKYIKRLDQSQTTPSSGTIFRPKKAMDHLFMPLQMEEAYQAMNGSAAAHRELYPTFTYVDGKEKNDQNYVGSIGLAKTDTHTTLFTLAREHHETILGAVANVFSSIGKKIGGDSNVLESIVGDTKDNKTATTIALNLASGAVASIVKIEDNANDFAFDFTRQTVKDILALTLTNAQYTALLQVIQTNFGSNPKYPVYLTTNNHSSNTDLNGIPYKQFELWLSGLLEQTGTVEVTEVTTGITLYEAEESPGITITCPSGTNPQMDDYDKASLAMLLERKTVKAFGYHNWFEIEERTTNGRVYKTITGSKKGIEAVANEFQIADIAQLTAIFRLRNELYNEVLNYKDTRTGSALPDYVTENRRGTTNEEERDIPELFFGEDTIGYVTPVERIINHAGTVTEFKVYTGLLAAITNLSVDSSSGTVNISAAQAEVILQKIGLVFSPDLVSTGPNDPNHIDIYIDQRRDALIALLSTTTFGNIQDNDSNVRKILDAYYEQVRTLFKERAKIIFDCLLNTIKGVQQQVYFEIMATGDGGLTAGIFDKDLSREGFGTKSVHGTVSSGFFPYKLTTFGNSSSSSLDVVTKFQHQVELDMITDPDTKTQVHFYAAGLDDPAPNGINLFKIIDGQKYIFSLTANKLGITPVSGARVVKVPLPRPISTNPDKFLHNEETAEWDRQNGVNHSSIIYPVPRIRVIKPDEKVPAGVTYYEWYHRGTRIAIFTKGKAYNNLTFEQVEPVASERKFYVSLSTYIDKNNSTGNVDGTFNSPYKGTPVIGTTGEELLVMLAVTKTAPVPISLEKSLKVDLGDGFDPNKFTFKDIHVGGTHKPSINVKLEENRDVLEKLIKDIDNTLLQKRAPGVELKLYGNGIGTRDGGTTDGIIRRDANQQKQSITSSTYATSLRFSELNIVTKYAKVNNQDILTEIVIEINAYTDPSKTSTFRSTTKNSLSDKTVTEQENILQQYFDPLYIPKEALQNHISSLTSPPDLHQQCMDLGVINKEYPPAGVDSSLPSYSNGKYHHSGNMILGAFRAIAIYEAFVNYIKLLAAQMKNNGDIDVPSTESSRPVVGPITIFTENFVEVRMIKNIRGKNDEKSIIYVGHYEDRPLITDETSDKRKTSTYYNPINFETYLKLKPTD